MKGRSFIKWHGSNQIIFIWNVILLLYHLKWYKVFENTVASALVFQASLLHQLWSYSNSSDLITSLVTSWLNYCNKLYMGAALPFQNPQLEQNSVSWVLMGVMFDFARLLLLHQHWLQISFQVQFKVLIWNFKALNGLGTKHFKDYLLPYEMICPLRSFERTFCRFWSTSGCNKWHLNYGTTSL